VEHSGQKVASREAREHDPEDEDGHGRKKYVVGTNSRWADHCGGHELPRWGKEYTPRQKSDGRRSLNYRDEMQGVKEKPRLVSGRNSLQKQAYHRIIVPSSQK
jgi:hypothetical protein